VVVERLKHHRDDQFPDEPEPQYRDPYSEWACRKNLLLSATIGRRPPEDRLDDAMITSGGWATLPTLALGLALCHCGADHIPCTDQTGPDTSFDGNGPLEVER
jgi:hypothetical protein